MCCRFHVFVPTSSRLAIRLYPNEWYFIPSRCTCTLPCLRVHPTDSFSVVGVPSRMFLLGHSFMEMFLTLAAGGVTVVLPCIANNADGCVIHVVISDDGSGKRIDSNWQHFSTHQQIAMCMLLHTNWADSFAFFSYWVCSMETRKARKARHATKALAKEQTSFAEECKQ